MSLSMQLARPLPQPAGRAGRLACKAVLVQPVPHNGPRATSSGQPAWSASRQQPSAPWSAGGQQPSASWSSSGQQPPASWGAGGQQAPASWSASATVRSEELRALDPALYLCVRAMLQTLLPGRPDMHRTFVIRMELGNTRIAYIHSGPFTWYPEDRATLSCDVLLGTGYKPLGRPSGREGWLPKGRTGLSDEHEQVMQCVLRFMKRFVDGLDAESVLAAQMGGLELW